MMSLIFSRKSLDQCLENASKELNVTKEKIDYKIVKDKYSIIGEKVQIEVIETEIDSSTSNDSLM